ncbi:MAG: UDP-N-acetylmuramoyl-L-alanine--D-glutamate ligase, partial [Owenweeksia sp.]
VLEVSSFQLDDISSFKPHIAILTNITPDHLDRYDYKMENYARSKFAIARYQQGDDYFIYNIDDPETLNYLDQHKPKSHLLPISLEKKVEEGAFVDKQNHIHINLKNQEAMNINELALQGKHNAYNSMAAGLAGKLLGIRKEVIRESLAGFESIEHRLEPVLQVYGIEFISKATNVNSTWYAMESMQKPTIWIVGGVDKGNDYSQLHKLVKEKVKAIVCLGIDNTKLHAEFAEMVPFMIDAADMDEAVRIAYKLGTKNDAVLLSPACASFDLFENYEDRGRQFKAAVRRL